MLLNSLVLLIGLHSQLFVASILAQTNQQQQQQQQLPNQSQQQPTQQAPNSQSNLINNNTNQAPQQFLLSPNTLATLTNAANVNSGSGLSSATAVGSTSQAQLNNQQFVMKFVYNDAKNHIAYVNILPVNQSNLHEPRIELRYLSSFPFIELSESSKVNSVVSAVIVNDEDAGPSGETTVFIESGNELGHFKLVSTPITKTIQVASQLNIEVKQEYNLTIVARDHGTPPKSSSVNLVIKLTQAMNKHYKESYTYNSDNGPNNNWAENPANSTANKAIFTDLMYFGAMLVVTFSTIILILILACFLTQRPTSKKGPPPRTTSTTNNLFELY